MGQKRALLGISEKQDLAIRPWTKQGMPDAPWSVKDGWLSPPHFSGLDGFGQLHEIRAAVRFHWQQESHRQPWMMPGGQDILLAKHVLLFIPYSQRLKNLTWLAWLWQLFRLAGQLMSCAVDWLGFYFKEPRKVSATIERLVPLSPSSVRASACLNPRLRT